MAGVVAGVVADVVAFVATSACIGLRHVESSQFGLAHLDSHSRNDANLFGEPL